MNKITIDSCLDCSHSFKELDYNVDSFEFGTAHILHCGKGKKVIAHIDRQDKRVAIPGWCPLKDET